MSDKLKLHSETGDSPLIPEEEKFMTLGDFLRKIRQDKGELLKDVAERVFLKVSVFSHIETGRFLPEDLSNIIKAYQLNEEQVEELKKIRNIEKVLKDKEFNPEQELTNSGIEKLLKNTLGGEDDDPFVAISNKEERKKEEEQFELKLRKLDERLRNIIELRFGLGGYKKNLSLEEVGKIIGVTRERIKQLETQALQKMGIRRTKKGFQGFKDYLKSI